MEKRKKILRNRSGETIIEVIVAIGIVLIALFVFSTCVVTSGKLNNQVAVQDQKLYKELAEAQERKGTGTEAEIRIKGDESDIEIPINVYGTDMKSFSLKEEAAP